MMKRVVRSILAASLTALGASSGAYAQSKVKVAPGAGIPRVQAPRLDAVGAIPPPTEIKRDSGPVSPERKILVWVGFHQAEAYSRIFLKTTERADFEVKPGTGVIQVVIKNARVRLRNNLRFLDTSWFPSAVWRIVPRRLGDDVVVEIQMRKAVSYRVRRQGETIRLDFDLPNKK